MTVKRTEQIWLKPNENLGRLCHLSKNLYNQGNHIVRQAMFRGEGYISYNDLDKMLNGSLPMRVKSVNYALLPCAQAIVRQIDRSWSSFRKSKKEWEVNPEKFTGKPRIPKYKRKNGEYLLIFSNQQCKIKNGILKFPKKVNLEIKTRIKNEDLREVRIAPKGVGYVCEIVYNKEVMDKVEREPVRIIGIDPGVKNIITISNNIGLKPIAVKDDGKGIKSINQFFNKKQAELKAIYSRQKIKTGPKMDRLCDKHSKKVLDGVHKLSRWLVNWCVKHQIDTIVFGHNKDWQRDSNMGKRTNQNFTQLPYTQIIEKIKYKAAEKGINFIEQEESHTSKCSFLEYESIEHHYQYLGKRYRHLSRFVTSTGKIIHDDVNAAYNIMVKAIPQTDFGVKGRGGCGFHPLVRFI